VARIITFAVGIAFIALGIYQAHKGEIHIRGSSYLITVVHNPINFWLLISFALAMGAAVMLQAFRKRDSLSDQQIRRLSRRSNQR